MRCIMKEFHEMLRRVTSSPYHDQMVSYIRPLNYHFGVNHFWYYRITNGGHYTYLGTHNSWSAYCFENHMLSQFPMLRHPETQESGISLMKQTTSPGFLTAQKEAWEHFGINFNVNITSRISSGVEAFGFATQSNHPKMDEMILKELPLMTYFAKSFRKRHRKLFDLVLDNPVDISEHIGETFHKAERLAPYPLEKEDFLRKLGWIPHERLTRREKSVLKQLSNGYPASHIGRLLSISKRTVENNIANIKSKFYYSSKVELINKARELETIGYLGGDPPDWSDLS